MVIPGYVTAKRGGGAGTQIFKDESSEWYAGDFQSSNIDLNALFGR